MGVPVNKLTGVFPYFPSSAAIGAGGIICLAWNSVLAIVFSFGLSEQMCELLGNGTIR